MDARLFAFKTDYGLVVDEEFVLIESLGQSLGVVVVGRVDLFGIVNDIDVVLS